MRIVLVFVLALPVRVHALQTDADILSIQTLKKKIVRLQGEVASAHAALDELQKERHGFEAELSQHERQFETQFSKVLIPLLSWPNFPPLKRASSWVAEEHIKLVLLSTRERLAREPLELIANRELVLKRVQDKQVEISDTLGRLENRESLLKLQLEELEYLQKKTTKTKTSKRYL